MQVGLGGPSLPCAGGGPNTPTHGQGLWQGAPHTLTLSSESVYLDNKVRY